jgi:hypothetical protein
MGVRDYDPRLGQFLTPDPLYFEDLDKCQSSPLQCSLYGYAAGNPISFVDPTGMDTDGLMRGTVVDFPGDLNRIAGTLARGAYSVVCAFVGCGTAGGGGDTFIVDNRGTPLLNEDGNRISNAIPTHQVTNSEQALNVGLVTGGGKAFNSMARYIGRWLGRATAPEGSTLVGTGTGPVGGIDREAVISRLRPEGRLIGEPGTSPRIRMLPGGPAEAEAMFHELSKGGKVITGTKYPGTRVSLPDGGTIGYRSTSTSGPPTIDVAIDGLGIREIKFK